MPQASAGPSTNMARKPEWYVSYAWSDNTERGRALEKVVDVICAAAERRGLHIRRDRNELKIGESISAFMKRLGEADRVFVVLSDKYLRSPYCMHELSEIWRNSRQEEDAFFGRLRVYAVPETKLWTPQDWVDWAIYWKNEHDALDSRARQHGAGILGEHGFRRLRQMQQFHTQVADMLATLTDRVLPRTPEEFECWGFDDPTASQPAPRSPQPEQPSAPGHAQVREADWADAGGEDAQGRWATFGVTGSDGACVVQRLRWIPPGRFLMGSPEGEAGRYEDEGPQREVTFAEGFWLFDTPCTQALWSAVMGGNPSGFKSPTRPVETVSFEDVQAFLRKVNARVPGLNLCLPSEAQWEYACRAGTSTATSAGDLQILGENNAPVLDAIAWYGGNSGVGFELENGWDTSDWKEKQYGHKRAGTRPVGLKAPNPWGLYDMLGNVWEWCADTWHDSYVGAPTDGSAWVEQGGAANRVIRGGTWNDGARGVRSAYRYGDDLTYRDDFLGFRCARVQER